MLLSAVCVLVVAQSSSDIPEGLMNNPVQRRVVFNFIIFYEDESDNGSNKPKHVASVSTNKDLFPNKIL